MINLKDKKIVVTGGDGFLGTHVVRKLKERGVQDAQIIIPQRDTCDLRDADACARIVHGAQVVLHLAGVTGDGEFHRAHPAQIFYDNLVMGVSLMEASRVAGVEKFVTIGSVTEYPENVPMPFKEENLWIGPVEALHRPYTIAKKMLSVQAAAYRAEYGMNAVHLLLTNMYGPGKEAVRGFVVTNTIKKIAEAQKEGRDHIEMWGAGKATRDFLYVGDAAEGVLLAAEKYDKSEPVNLGSGWELSVRELAETLARIMEFKGEIRWDAAKPEGQLRRMLDISKAEHEFGFQPATSLEDGLRATIAWHKEHES